MNLMTLEQRLDPVDNAGRSNRPSVALALSAAATSAGGCTTLCASPTSDLPWGRRPALRLPASIGPAPSACAGVASDGGAQSPATALPDLRVPILLTSATAADRALFARRLHNLGPRRHGPFVAVACRGRHPDEIDNALFGDDSWVAAAAGVAGGGAVVAATGGTLYIDEVSRLSLRTQAKLLHALERRRHPNVVTEVERPVDFRLIVASTADLRDEVDRGRFRASLWFAIAGFCLWVPPLAPRTESRDASSGPAVHLRRWLGPRAV